VLLCAFTVSSQTIDKTPKAENDTKLDEKAVALLRETLAEVNNMRTLENRISFTSELASLMWFHDEQEARAMFTGVTNDFRQLLAQYDAQMNAMGTKPEDESDSGSFLIFDPSERSKLQRKLTTAMAVRQQIAMSMAEHDADLAFTFYYDSLNAISNPELRKETDGRDQYFEFQLINQIADKAPDKAVKFGKRSLAKGFTYQHLDLLKKIYAKDVDKATDFAEDILSHVKGDKLTEDNISAVSGLINFGEETIKKSRTDSGKKAIYTTTDLRDLAEVMAQSILSQSGDEISGMEFVNQIEKYAPGRAMQIRSKFKMTDSASQQIYMGNRSASSTRMTALGNTSTGSDGANPAISAAQKAQEERTKNEKQMMDDVMKVGNKDLPKDQRDSIITQARKILLMTPGRDKKIAGLSLLAAQVAKAGDKDLAAQIMKDAESLVNPQPKNYQDYLLTWMLASGYASVNPDKAFPLLQDTIGRANDTLAAFVKIGEFIDANEEMIQDGEVQVGAFGGSMIRGMTSELGMADSTIRILAKADFDKTKDLTNRFDRPEIRILAKMMVLRAVLGDKDPPKIDSSDGDGSTDDK
ncbi:MAG: hypothetical protein ACRD43_03915, partial [Pyrinomonadaceae bacterium]